MWSVEMKDFSFGMFYNETKLIQKFGHYIIATKKMKVRNVKWLVLRNVLDKEPEREQLHLKQSWLSLCSICKEISPEGKNASEEVMIKRWEELSDVEG